MKRLILLCCILLSVFGVSAQDEFNWNGTDRFTVLIMGMDRRPSESGGLVYRSDTIMLASINPLNNRAGVLSIPRTIHLALADTGELVPIHTLLVRGELRQEGYGLELTRQTIQHNLGIYIDAYILVDFDGFISLIDAIGGIEITLNYQINDPIYPDMNYGYDPFYLSAGTHLLDGYDALRFARTRHNDNDYLRVERQLQVIRAVRNRLGDPAVLQYVISQAPNIWSQLSNNVVSNLKPQDAVYVGISLMNITEDNLAFGSLNEEYSYFYGTTSGTVRIPDRERLAELLVNIFGEGY
jgi:polyisoprenyl-teichoic acid--peptidoglycan teichoic acid transferase